MQQINCLNLCEILPYLRQKRSIPVILTDAIKEAQFVNCTRVYVGSYFCGKYFLHQSTEDLTTLLKLCRTKEMKVTLVIPTFSEGDLKYGKHRIAQILAYCDDFIDEVTVNDYGMLAYMKENYKLAINLGRLFMKDYRDPRYEEYFQIPWKPMMFTKYLTSILQDFKINSCEFDLTHKVMDFSEIPNTVMPGLHVPYCYQTVGRICEYASITKDFAKKFRANDNCDEKCTESYVKYTVSDGNMEYVRFGRTVYFRHPGCEFVGLEQYRLIYFPIEQ